MAKEISQELLEVLCCPKCKGDLDYRKNENKLVCKNKNCGKVYKVEDGIPIMLVE